MQQVRMQGTTKVTTVSPTSYQLDWKHDRPAHENLITVRFEHDGFTYVKREQYSGLPNFELPLYPVGEDGDYVEVVMPWAKERKQ